MWFEVFSSGEHTDSSGIKKNYTEADLDKIAYDYNSLIESDKSYQAPAVKGHPKNDDPAVGWVNKLARRGDKLVADIELISSDFAEDLQNGAFKNISISLYDNMKLKHIGFLGAVAPAVKELKKLEFSYEMNNDSSVDFAKILDENQKLNDQIKLLEKEKRIAEFRSYANSLLNEKSQKIAPAQVGDVIDLMELAYQRDFSSNDFADNSENQSFTNKLKNLISSKNNQNLTSEILINPIQESNYKLTPKNFNQDRMEIHNAAKSLQSIEPMLSYEEAVLKSLSFINNK